MFEHLSVEKHQTVARNSVSGVFARVCSKNKGFAVSRGLGMSDMLEMSDGVKGGQGSPQTPKD